MFQLELDNVAYFFMSFYTTDDFFSVAHGMFQISIL